MQVKHTRRNHKIKDGFAFYFEMSTLDTTKSEWIWTKLYRKRIILLAKCLIKLTKDGIVVNKPTVQIFGTKLNLRGYCTPEPYF